jgi:hypothetical protein
MDKYRIGKSFGRLPHWSMAGAMTPSLRWNRGVLARKKLTAVWCALERGRRWDAVAVLRLGRKLHGTQQGREALARTVQRDAAVGRGSDGGELGDMRGGRTGWTPAAPEEKGERGAHRRRGQRLEEQRCRRLDYGEEAAAAPASFWRRSRTVAAPLQRERQ